jgi:hypothetical protein
MKDPGTEHQKREPPIGTQPVFGRQVGGWIVRAFPWHAGASFPLIIALNVANTVRGDSWWAFWPSLILCAALAAHYIVYKSLMVDPSWVRERVEEVNLKSYDRSHIEDLKQRYKPEGGANGS